LLQHLHVLDDGSERHVEGLSELTDRCGSAAESVDQGTPHRIAEGIEDAVHARRLLLKHVLEYSCVMTIVKYVLE
jgi:hypothetical protein